jgi:hypothetical protein
MLSNGELYRDAGSDYFTHRDPARTTRRLIAQLERPATPSLFTTPPLDPNEFPSSR